MIIGNILDFGSTIAPYGTGNFLNFYTNAYNAAINSILNISLFSSQALQEINAYLTIDSELYGQNILRKLKYYGFAE